MLLEDKVAIVTGIGTAMGRSIALAYAAQGAKLVLAVRRAERLQAVLDEVEADQCEDVPPRDVPSSDDCVGAVVFLASDRARPITA